MSAAMDPVLQEEAENNAKLFAQLDAYPWDTDKEFQGGLAAILGSASSPSQIQSLTLRARCFYFQRKNPAVPIDFDAYKSHVLSHDPSACLPSASNTQPAANTASLSADPAAADPQYPQSFAALVELIQSGAPIPGIKEIPPTVLTDKATAPTAGKRRKPWEKDGDEAVGDKIGREVGEGTFGDRRDEYIQQEYPDA